MLDGKIAVIRDLELQEVLRHGVVQPFVLVDYSDFHEMKLLLMV